MHDCRPSAGEATVGVAKVWSPASRRLALAVVGGSERASFSMVALPRLSG